MSDNKNISELIENYINCREITPDFSAKTSPVLVETVILDCASIQISFAIYLN